MERRMHRGIPEREREGFPERASASGEVENRRLSFLAGVGGPEGGDTFIASARPLDQRGHEIHLPCSLGERERHLSPVYRQA